MFSHINIRSPRYQQQFDYMDSQFTQPGESINFYQMNPQFSTYEHELQNNQRYPGFASSRPASSSNSSSFSEYGKICLQETGIEESEAVDELLQILVECLKKANMRTREVLLQKFFFEIEKETPLEGFLVQRIKHSKLNLLMESLNRDRDIHNCETGEINGLAAREVEESSKRLERFKIKTVLVGNTVTEESK